MTLLFDENLSFRLVIALADLYPGSLHVRSANLARADDLAIWRHARAAGLTIVTLDSDFVDLGSVYGAPPKVIWIRSFDTATAAILALIRPRTVDIRRFLADPDEGVLILR